MSPEQAHLERWLRGLIVIAALVGLAISILGFLPGENVYRDSENCFSRDFMVTADHRQVACIPSYTTFVEQRPAGGGWLLALVLVVLSPAVWVWRKPTRQRAWLWFVWIPLGAVVTVAIMIGATLGLEPEEVTLLWPFKAVHLGMSLLAALLMVVLPLLLLLVRKPQAVPEARLV